ncbi:MAG TPA: hypothetical protein GYA07_05080 [Verrucomicrobia bacterium]|nr:hypothetical protein [Verrucomicrobiota bacterium]
MTAPSSGCAQILDTNFSSTLFPAAVAIHPDGRVLADDYSLVRRLNLDGSYDAVWSGLASIITALTVRPDGQIFAGATYDPLTTRNMAIIDPGVSANSIGAFGLGGDIYCAALQPEGKVLAAGFGNGPGPTNLIVRLNPGTSEDPSFNAFASFSVLNLTVQPDGKILVGGYFGLLNGQVQQGIGRLNSDGTLDTTFTPSPVGYINGGVKTVLLQPDGKILIGGDFTVLGGHTRNHIARLNPDGSVDTTFDAGVSGSGQNVNSLALQANGKIVVAGHFSTLAGQPCTNVGRLNPDGSFDASFEGSASEGWANSATLHPDGSILVVAPITTPGGQILFARFINTDPATNSLTRSGSALTWWRGGSAPEVWRTTFEVSTNNGASWIFLGEGTRIEGGWQLTDVSAPANATVRARGYYSSGRFNGSSSTDEKVIGPPVIVSHPISHFVNAGDSVHFFGAAGGTEPISYQWRRNGTNIIDSSGISGTQMQSLALSNVFAGRDQGEYSFVASNSFGSVTSRVANLSILEPVVLLPYSEKTQWKRPGETVTFSVTAFGTPPFHYQWTRNGTNLVGANESVLVLTNLQLSDAGTYSVVVSNDYGEGYGPVDILRISVAIPDSLATITNDFDPGYVSCILPLPDGGLLVGGSFVSMGGHGCTNLARINVDGTVDASFNPAPAGFVDKLALQPDGKILVKGYFDSIAGAARTNLARLNPDGTLDPTFVTGAAEPSDPLAVQPDGKILLTRYDAWTNYLIRLHPDGTPDPTLMALVVDGETPGNVFTIVPIEDGKILVGGTFTEIAGQPRTNLARFNADGTLDSWSVDFLVTGSFAVQRDGKILITREDYELFGYPPWRLVRLNPDGSLDPGFTPVLCEHSYTKLAVQSDGKFIMAPGLALKRFNPDGSEDPTFVVVGGSGQAQLAADGKVLLLGIFNNINGVPRLGFARLSNDPATHLLEPGDSMITWLRGGSSPEVWHTVFDYSVDGHTWIPLGEGTRIDGGWQVSSHGLPAHSTLRARGFVSGGNWFVEDFLPVGMTLFPANSGSQPFGFLTRAAPGQPFVIEASTDLVNWIPIHTNPPAATNLIHYVDPESGVFPQRFYRAHAP